MARAMALDARGADRRRLDPGRLRRAPARRAASGVIVSAIDAKHGAVYFQASKPRAGRCSRRASRACARRSGRSAPARRAWPATRAEALAARRRGAPGCRATLPSPPPIPTSSRSRGSGWPRTRGEPAAPALRQAARRASRRPATRSRAAKLIGAPRHGCSDFVARTPLDHPPLARRSSRGMRRHSQDAPSRIPGRPENSPTLLASASTLGSAALDPATGRMRGFAISRLAADEAEILTIAVDPRLARTRRRPRPVARTPVARDAFGRARDVSRSRSPTTPPRSRSMRASAFVQVGRREGYYRRLDGKPATALVMRKDLA